MRDDADQRVTLIQTYLALLQEDKSNESARLLALHALFRANVNQNSEADTPPMASIEALFQALKPSK